MIALIGDGGHAKVVRDLIEELSARGENYYSMDAWFIAVGDNAARKAESLKHPSYSYAILVHPSAQVSNSAIIGLGSIVLENAVVQADAVVGRHCIINAGAVVTHDCRLEDYVHIAPGAHLCGGVDVGEGALVGVGVGIEPGAIIPAWSIVKREEYEITVADRC